MPSGVTDGFVLTADSTDAAGQVWAAPAGGAVDAEDVTVDSTTLVGTGTDAQAVFEELDNAIVASDAALAAHLADTVDAHDATAISFAPAGTIAATTVQAAIEEVATEAGGGSGVDWEDVGTSGSSGTAPIVTALPGTPTNLDEIYLKVGTGDTAVYWHLLYLSAITDAYKWVFLGGSPLYDFFVTSAGTASATYVELNSGEPQVTLPATGVYEVTHGAQIIGTAANEYGIANIKTNGTNPTDDADGVHFAYGSASSGTRIQTHSVTFERTVASIGTSALLVQVYRTGGATVEFVNRFLTVRPVRIG